MTRSSPPPACHARRRLRPLPGVRRAGRGAAAADRRRPDRPRHPAAERARAHRRARRLAHHRDAGVRRAARRAGTPRPGRARAPSPGVPGGRARAHDRALLPGPRDGDAIDLNCAAPRPARLAAAYADAAAELPAYLGGARLLPRRPAAAAGGDRRDVRRPRAADRPRQIMVTPGALSAAAIVARALTGPGERVLVETPVYPNATPGDPPGRRPAHRQPGRPRGLGPAGGRRGAAPDLAAAGLPDPGLPEPDRPR